MTNAFRQMCIHRLEILLVVRIGDVPAYGNGGKLAVYRRSRSHLFC